MVKAHCRDPECGMCKVASGLLEVAVSAGGGTSGMRGSFLVAPGLANFVGPWNRAPRSKRELEQLVYILH
jgi:hypothetical protein